MRDRRVPAGRARVPILVLVLGALLSACSPAPGSTSGVVATGPTPTGVAPATGAPVTVAPAPTHGSTSGLSVYQLPEGRWTGGGEVHIDIAGGYDGELDLPLLSGETTAGRTILTFEHQDPGDSRWSLGLVRISFVPDADGIGIEAGGLRVQGPCRYTLGVVSADHLEGELACADDLQAQVQGDPREMTISGSFTATRTPS
jgi:hypothetical protein